jgi:hypothetical protein
VTFSCTIRGANFWVSEPQFVARSIHTTRRDLEEARQWLFADRERREAELKQLREQLSKKRQIKDTVKERRVRQDVLSVAASPESISIRMADQSASVHYPAGPADVLAVLRRIPSGVLEGLVSIDLCLGSEIQEESEEDLEGAFCDPLIGRIGFEHLPAVYCGRILGQYHPDSARIFLCAYVYDENLPEREMWELYLRLSMLATLVHEIGHHYDMSARSLCHK